MFHLLQGFTDERDVFEQFEVPDAERAGREVLIAVYEYEDYQGDAFVLFHDHNDNRFYEVNASHCSCYGLEDQWRPEEVSFEEIVKRPVYIGYDENEQQEMVRSALVQIAQLATWA